MEGGRRREGRRRAVEVFRAPRSTAMPCSPAKLEANRRNALKSTGPRTAEGKETCRRNALKHGLTGKGVVLPVEDEVAVEGRFVAFEEELGAEGEVGRC